MSENESKSGPGRPSIYSEEIAHEICLRIATGQSLRRICEDEHLPDRVTVMRWLLSNDEDKKEFCNQYARAREIQAEYIFEDILDIADDGRNDWMSVYNKRSGEYEDVPNPEVVNRSRLRVDARKWYLGKLQPKKYGDKTTKDVNVNVNLAERIKEGRSRIDPALRVFHDQ